jgi:hypothetical protein
MNARQLKPQDFEYCGRGDKCAHEQRTGYAYDTIDPVTDVCLGCLAHEVTRLADTLPDSDPDPVRARALEVLCHLADKMTPANLCIALENMATEEREKHRAQLRRELHEVAR